MTQKEVDQWNNDEAFQEWNKMSLEDRADSSFSDYSLGYYHCKNKFKEQEKEAASKAWDAAFNYLQQDDIELPNKIEYLNKEFPNQ